MATSPLKLNPIILHKPSIDTHKVVRTFPVDHDGNKETPKINVVFHGTELRSKAATAKTNLLKLIDTEIATEIEVAEQKNNDWYSSRKLQDKQDFSDFIYAVVPPSKSSTDTYIADQSGAKYMAIFDDDAGFLANGASMEINIHNADLEISTLGRNYVDSSTWGDGKDSAAAVTEGLLAKQSKNDEDDGFIKNHKLDEAKRAEFLDAYTKVMASSYYTTPPTGITTALSREAWNLNHSPEVANGFLTFAGNYAKTLRYFRGTDVNSTNFKKYQGKLDAFTGILRKHFDPITVNGILGAAKNYPDYKEETNSKELKYDDPMEEYVGLHHAAISEIQKSKGTQEEKVAQLEKLLGPLYKQYGLGDDVEFSSLLHQTVVLPAETHTAPTPSSHQITATPAPAFQTKLEGIRDNSTTSRISKLVIGAMLKNSNAVDSIIRDSKATDKAKLILKEIQDNSPSDAFKKLNRPQETIQTVLDQITK